MVTWWTSNRGTDDSFIYQIMARGMSWELQQEHRRSGATIFYGPFDTVREAQQHAEQIHLLTSNPHRRSSMAKSRKIRVKGYSYTRKGHRVHVKGHLRKR